MGVISQDTKKYYINSPDMCSALKNLLITNCGVECFPVKISSQQAKHLAVLRLTVNPTHREPYKSSVLPGNQNCPFFMVNVFYD